MPSFHQTFEFHHSAVDQTPVRGTGDVRERIITVPNTPRFHVSHSFCVRLRVDPELTDDVVLRVRADDNILPLVRACRRGGVVHLELAHGAGIEPTELSVEATVGALSELVTAGAAQVTVQGLQGERVMLSSAGSSRIEADGHAARLALIAGGCSRIDLGLCGAQHVAVDVDQSSQVRLRGSAQELQLSAHGAGRVHADAPGFEALSAHVELSGAAAAWLRARDGAVGQVRFPARLHLSCDGEAAVERPRVTLPFGAPHKP